MDEMPPTPPVPRAPGPAASSTAPPAPHAPDAPRLPDASPSEVAQPALFEVPLRFDDEADQPIAYALTSRARRAVAPQEQPALSVISRQPAAAIVGEDVGDTRPARARALRRAGVAPADIAVQLQTDPLLVGAWIRGVAVAHRSGERPVASASASATSRAAGGRSGDPDPETARVRRHASGVARARLAADPAFAAEVGVVTALAELDRGAVVVSSRRPEVLARAIAALVTHGGADRETIRVVLRLGPEVAGDLTRHRWAGILALPAERLLLTRWRQAPEAGAVDGLVRIPDATLAATVAGWEDALLTPQAPIDLAF